MTVRLAQRGRGLSATVSILTVAAAVLLAACATSISATSADRTVTRRPATAASAAHADGDRLTATVTYGEGQERFDPLPGSYRPKIDAKQAFDAFARQVDPRSLGTDEHPTILLASYTNFVTGQHATFVTGTMDPVAAAKSDNASKPWWVGVPVWYIRYLHVPVMAAGPNLPGGARRPPMIVVQEMVIPVSAETGQVLMMANVTADRTPTSWPPPSNSNGNAEKSSAISAHPEPTTAQPKATG